MKNTQKALDIIKKLQLKQSDESKFVSMRDGERPKKGARVMADGKMGNVTSIENINAPSYNDQKMKDHQVLAVQHPAGTTTYVDGIPGPVAPTDGYTKHYSSENVKVHMDDIVKPK